MTAIIRMFLKYFFHSILFVAFIICACASEMCASNEKPVGIMTVAMEEFNEERYDNALPLFENIIAMHTNEMSDSDSRIVAEATLKAGEIYYNRNNYNKALELFMLSVKISEERGFTDCMMSGYKWIGNIYFSFGDYERAITLYETAYGLRNDTTDSQTECDILIDLTGVYCCINNTSKAREYNVLAKSMLDNNNPVKRFMADFNDALILMIEKDYSGALEKFKKAEKETTSPKYKCYALEYIYNSFRGLENSDSTIYYMKKCLDLSKENGIINIYEQTLGDIADFYSNTDPAKAEYYKDIHLHISDSIMKSGGNLREFYRLRNIHYLYELEKTNRRISDLNMKQEMKDREILYQKRILAVFIVAILIFVALLWIVIRQKKKIRRAYSDLFDINRNMLQEYSSAKEEYDSALRQCDLYRRKLAEAESIIACNALKEESKSEDAVVNEADTEMCRDNNEKQSTGSIMSLDSEKKTLIWGKIEQAMEKDKLYCDDNFSLSRLAEAVGYNQKYVSRAILETTGKGFTEFVNDYRIREACARLLDTKRYGNYTIGAIAADVGYKAQSTFIRAFRKNTGLPPSVYQKMALSRNKE